MSREIKFRGKRTDNGEWVYGYYFETGMSGVYIVGSRPQAKRTKDGMTAREKIWEYEVDPATVGQFTGLKDKNGREIYERDILEYVPWALAGNMERRAVEFKDGIYYAGYQLKDVNDGEVIGNVHDNPELLEGGGSDD